MRKFIYRSERFNLVPMIIMYICCLLSGCNMLARTEALSSKEGYLITISDEATEKDTRWAKYLYDHLNKRSNDEEIIAFGVSEKDMWRIIVKIDPTLHEGFRIARNQADINLTTSDEKKMLWLQYQVMKNISKEDPRINGSDLPPAIINLKDTSGTFAFNYQSIYSPTGLNADFTGISGLNDFDNSWGIWGHNLRKVLGTNIKKCYATINGTKDDSQLCFSSEDMYRSIESYIIDNYGEKGNLRFVIAPEDIPSACTCSTCTSTGNTSQNATPTVTHLITRLSKRFPGHFFFTTSYLSTQKAPENRLPPNAGVIVSAIDFPLQLIKDNDQDAKKFAQRLDQWKKITNNIYIWDYINNFDDYLTPFPILEIAQQRLQFFRKNGVGGMFLNGSGYDYSSFDEMKSFVLSALLINPDLPVNSLVKQYLDQEYPVSKKWLYDYYISLENNVKPGRRLNMYAGIQSSESSFLNPEDFCKFYDEIEDFVSQSKGKERKKLHELQTALSFTRLETGRNHSYSTYGYASQDGISIHPTPHVKEWLTRLKEYNAFPKMKYYSESCNEISQYIGEWEKYILSSDLSENQFLGVTPSLISPSDTSDADLSILTDGTHGLPDNYHFGWMILPGEETIISMPVANLNKAGTLHLSFLHFPKHRIYAPQQIELLKDGITDRNVNVPVPEQSDEKGQMIKVNIPADLNGTKELGLKIIGVKKNKAQISLDEIAFIP